MSIDTYAASKKAQRNVNYALFILKKRPFITQLNLLALTHWVLLNKVLYLSTNSGTFDITQSELRSASNGKHAREKVFKQVGEL